MMEEDPEDRVDPMSRVFPRVTKCIFNKFGPSGTVQRRDAMCVLPVNIINEVRGSVIFVRFHSSSMFRKYMSSSGSG
jgi:hypothetical protein